MKKKLLVPIVLSSLLLASCKGNSNDTVKDDREYYVDAYGEIVDVLTQVENKPEVKSMIYPKDYYKEEIDKYNITATKAYIYFYKLLYANTNYPIVNKPVKCTMDYKKDEEVIQHNDSYLKNTIDKENNKINLEMYGYSEIKEYSEIAYVNVSIDYDFDKEEIVAFDLSIFGVEGDSLKVGLIQSYKDDSFYSLKGDYEEEVIEDFNPIYQDFYNSLEDSVVAGDFTYEYTKSVDDIVGGM